MGGDTALKIPKDDRLTQLLEKEKVKIRETGAAAVVPEKTVKDNADKVAEKFGVSREILEKYCQAWNINLASQDAEKKIMERFLKNGYDRFWHKSVWGKIFGRTFTTAEGRLERMLTTAEIDEKVRYASQIEAAMWAEISCKEIRQEAQIPEALKELAEWQNVRAFDPKSGKPTDVKINALVALGQAYDGAEALGVQMPEKMQPQLKAKYLDDSINVLTNALFDEKGKLRKGDELKKHLALAMSATAYGYLIIQSRDYKGDEITGQYKKSVGEFEANYEKMKGLAKDGVINKDDLKRYTMDNFYILTYQNVYALYEGLEKSAEKGKEAETGYAGPARRGGFEDISEMAAATASMSFLAVFEKKYVSFMKTSDQEAYFVHKATYGARFMEALSAMPFDEMVKFHSSLFKSSEYGSKLYDDWKKKAENKDRGYGDYIKDTIRAKWVEKVAPRQMDDMGFEKPSEEEKKTYAEIVFDRGFSWDDIAHVKHVFGMDLKAMQEEYAKLEKDEKIIGAIRKKTKELGLDNEYQELITKTLLQRLTLVNLGRKTVTQKDWKGYDILGEIEKIDTRAIKEEAEKIRKDYGFDVLSIEKAQMANKQARTNLFFKKCMEILPIQYETKAGQVVEKEAEAAPVTTITEKKIDWEKQSPEERERIKKKIKDWAIKTFGKENGEAFAKRMLENIKKAEKLLGDKLFLLEPTTKKGFTIGLMPKDNPDAIGYDTTADWIVNNSNYLDANRKKKEPVKDAVKYHYFAVGIKKDASVEEAKEARRKAAILRDRFERGYDFFMNKIKDAKTEEDVERIVSDIVGGKHEYKKLSEAADFVIALEKGNKKEIMATMWAVQVGEYDFELYGKDETLNGNEKDFMVRWNTGYKKAKTGVNINTAGLEKVIESRLNNIIQETWKAGKPLKDGTYTFDIVNVEGKTKSVLFKVEVKDGKALLDAKTKETAITMSDRIMLLDENRNVIAGSNAAVAPLLFFPRTDKMKKAVWEGQFRRNGEIEVGLAPGSGHTGVLMLKARETVTVTEAKIAEVPKKAAPPTLVPQIEVYTRQDWMHLYPMPIKEAPYVAFNALALPADIQSVTTETVLRLKLGFFSNDQLSQMSQALGPYISVDINGKVVGLPTYAQADNALSGIISDPGLRQDVLNAIFNITTDANGNKVITDVKTDVVKFDSEKIKRLFQKAAADSLRDRKAFLVGVIYRTEIMGLPLAVIPTLNVPTGKGRILPSLTANVNILNWAFNNAKGTFTVTAGAGTSIESTYYGIAAATLGYDFGPFSVYGTGGYAKAPMYGGGISFPMGEATIKINYIGSKFMGIWSMQRESAAGIIGVSALIIGPYVIPMPVVLADITQAVNKVFEWTGLRDMDMAAETIRIGKPSELLPTKVREEISGKGG